MATTYRQLKGELEQQISSLIKERQERAISLDELCELREQFIDDLPRGEEALLVAKESGLLRPQAKDFYSGIYGSVKNMRYRLAAMEVTDTFASLGMISYRGARWSWNHWRRKSWSDVLAASSGGVKDAFGIGSELGVPETLAQLSEFLLRRKITYDFADDLLREQVEGHNASIRQRAFKTGIDAIRPGVSREQMGKAVVEATTPRPTLAELEAWTERARELEESGLDPDEAVAIAERETRQAQVAGLGI